MMRAALVMTDRVDFHAHNIRRDLGDLRDLTASIKRFGILQPIVVEEYAGRLRLRAGHRRLAAARLAGLRKVPAIIHSDVYRDDEWLLASLHENHVRRGVDAGERGDAITRLVELGCTYVGIARSLGLDPSTVHRWAQHTELAAPAAPAPAAPAGTVAGRKPAVSAPGPQPTPPAERPTPAPAPVSARRVYASALRSIAAAWRDVPDVTAADVLQALDRLAETGRIADALPKVGRRAGAVR